MNHKHHLSYLLLFLTIGIAINSISSDNLNLNLKNKPKFDVTIVGLIQESGGWGQLPIRFIRHYMNKLHMNVIPILQDFNYLDESIKQIVLNKDKTPADVALAFIHPYSSVMPYLPESKIKICYTMTESYYIPQEWIENLNKHFDAVVVPAPFLIDAYKNAGLKKPIFILPIGMELDNYFKTPIKTTQNKKFTFGISAGFGNNHNKNQKMLLKSFISKFNNNPNVILKIRGGGGEKEEIEAIKRIIIRKGAQNVELEVKRLSPQENLDFMKSLDCYVLVSRGEGFSLTPREALALGIPCILSNNTAHEVICQTPYVKSVNQLTIKNIAQALEEVYNNYDLYLAKAHQGREWVKQYTYKSLENKYLNLIKPKNISLGLENTIADNYIITTSQDLVQKYLNISKS
ncbi:glycosyltransferase [Candidatus Babela massiliensis]|uniref:Glycosyltransferase n=1 Tax=Candidatus Babela massiliensis TaxID=673862 RepID=V6DGM7_9BACT|nr:glycosyltransferase [Candidatus Babela massiliensis]CDK30752.1 Glycosyltransferase [Candidatus Babela massiliensis]